MYYLNPHIEKLHSRGMLREEYDKFKAVMCDLNPSICFFQDNIEYSFLAISEGSKGVPAYFLYEVSDRCKGVM